MMWNLQNIILQTMSHPGDWIYGLKCLFRSTNNNNSDENDLHQNFVQDPTQLIVFGELLDQILQNLDPHDLLNCRRVSRGWCISSGKILTSQSSSSSSLTFKSLSNGNTTYVLEKRKMSQQISGQQALLRKDDNDDYNSKTLRKLNQLLSSSASTLRLLPSFPCPSFRLNCSEGGGDLGYDDVQKFFNLHGQNLKNLSLILNSQATGTASAATVNSMSTPSNKLVTLGNLLMNQVPNLKILSLDVSTLSSPVIDDSCPWTQAGLFSIEEEEDHNHGDKLSHLEILKIGRSMWHLTMATMTGSSKNNDGKIFLNGPIPEILSASPKLHTVHLDMISVPGDVDSLIGFKPKISFLKANTAYMYPSTFVIPQLEGFVQVKMELKEIQMFLNNSNTPSSSSLEKRHLDEFIRMGKAVQEIFLNTKNTLKLLTADPSTLILLKKLAVQSIHHHFCLPKLIKLTVRQNPGDHTASNEQEEEGDQPKRVMVHQERSKLTTIFPALRLVTLLLNNSVTSTDPYLSIHDSMESVKSLCFWWSGPRVPIPQNLHLIFPKVETMQILFCSNFPALAGIIWKFLGLWKLEIHLDARSSAVDNFYPKIDSAFTGFSVQTVKRIQNFEYRCHQQLFDVNNYYPSLREKSSILDLKKLAFLDIMFCSWDRPLNSLKGTIFSNIMANYALNQMTSLQSVKFFTRCGGVSPNATILALETALKPLTQAISNSTWEPNSPLTQSSFYNNDEDHF